MNTTTVIYLITINLVLAIVLFLILKKNYFLMAIYLLIWGLILYKFPYFKSLLYFGVPHIILAFLFFLFTYKSKNDNESHFNILLKTSNGDRIIKDIDRGTQIFGSSGAGKTASVIAPFIRHYKKWNFAGLLYDYKNGELTELVIGEYGEKQVKIIAPHNPFISHRCNFLDPDILEDEIKIEEIAKVILINLSDGTKSDFFTENGQALLVGTILTFKKFHPEYCTFPHIVAFLTIINFEGYREFKFIDDQTGEEKIRREFSPFKKLEDFLTQDDRIVVQASAFLKGLSSEKQTGAVISSLLNALRKFGNPRFFWVFSKAEFKLNINNPNNRLVVCVLNDPSIAKAVAPFVAGTMQSILTEMSQRGNEPAFLALDEGATIKLPNMSTIPATMRSFKIATLYATQDLSQGFESYGEQHFKSILANLSVQFFGMVNSPDTSRYFEKFIEDFEKDRVSQNKDAGFFSSIKSISVSKQETKKIKYSEFHRLNRGEFVAINEGVSEKLQFPKPNNKTAKIPNRADVTLEEIEANFYEIIKDVKTIIKN